jgi:hypothetical protein
MLRKVKALSLIVCVIPCCGCDRKPNLDRNFELPGRWTMVFGDDCNAYGIRSDTLVLRSDGTFDQFIVAQDGRRFDATGQRGKFSVPNSIELNERRNFSTSQRYKKLVSIPEFEVLLVKFDSPPATLVHPDSDCFYTRAK